MENVVIIGTGCAGLTAAIYTARANLKPLVLTGTMPGGLLTTTSIVENFPGFPEGVDGYELMTRMQAQAEKFGAQVKFATVDSVKFGDGVTELVVDGEPVQTRTLIIASGAGHKHLDVPGEDELEKKGVTYCATCDGALPMFRNQPVVVIGGGDSACEEATYLTRFASKVYLIHRRGALQSGRLRDPHSRDRGAQRAASARWQRGRRARDDPGGREREPRGHRARPADRCGRVRAARRSGRVIEFEDIHKAFGAQKVLDGVSLTVSQGRIVYIIGKSGAGKSVLVKHLVGLVRQDSGRIRFEGEDITHFTERDFFGLRRRCAMVFQHSTLFDSMTLVENVALPIRRHLGATQREALEQAREKLALVDMAALSDRLPAEVGDGLRKRVAIARALTLTPRYMVFDEPTTGLDPVNAVRVDRLIRDLSDRTGVTSVVVSHDLRSIFGVADRIVMLYQGKVLLDGTPAEFRTSHDPVVRQFVTGAVEGPMAL